MSEIPEKQNLENFGEGKEKQWKSIQNMIQQICSPNIMSYHNILCRSSLFMYCYDKPEPSCVVRLHSVSLCFRVRRLVEFLNRASHCSYTC